MAFIESSMFYVLSGGPFKFGDSDDTGKFGDLGRYGGSGDYGVSSKSSDPPYRYISGRNSIRSNSFFPPILII